MMERAAEQAALFLHSNILAELEFNADIQSFGRLCQSAAEVVAMVLSAAHSNGVLW